MSCMCVKFTPMELAMLEDLKALGELPDHHVHSLEEVKQGTAEDR